MCRGELSHGTGQIGVDGREIKGTWGCGRRFARADALGRHFRSEAGRVCIKPLLDEEAQERARQRQQEFNSQNAQFAQGGIGMVQGGLQPVQQPMMIPGGSPDSGMGAPNGGFMLPAALLQQYPALNNLDWNAIQAGNFEDDPGELSDVGGRTSFDAGVSSGGEYYDEEGYLSGSNMGGPAYGGSPGQHAGY